MAGSRWSVPMSGTSAGPEPVSDHQGRRVAVVGAGVTGLTAAWRLQQAGHRVQVFEALDTPGGRTRSIAKDGFVFDVGAITLLPTYARVSALLQELGLGAQLQRVQPVIGIPRDGVMHRIEVAHALRSLCRTGLISTTAKLRLARLLPPLWQAWRKARFDSLAPLARWDNVSIADWVRVHLGEEVLHYVVDPIIRGNTLNSTADAPFGELLWMLRQYATPSLLATVGGIDALPRGLAGRVPVQYGATVQAVAHSGSGVVLQVDSGAGQQEQAFDACVLALPPPQLRQLAPDLGAEQCALLDSLQPLPSINVHLGLRQAPAQQETFILPPASEQPDLTTIVLDHLKAPGRAPPGKGVVSLFCRDSWSATRMQQDDASILNEVMAMARPWLGDLSGQVESWHVQRWPYAIIKSRVGLYRDIARWEALTAQSDRIELASDFLSMGIEAAVIAGERAASRLQALLD